LSTLLIEVPSIASLNLPGDRENVMRWSDPDTWPNGYVPEFGEDVIIESHMNVVLDIDTPALGNLYIDGVLQFSKSRENSLLEASSIYVRNGALIAGSKSASHMNKIEILLHSTVGPLMTEPSDIPI